MICKNYFFFLEYDMKDLIQEGRNIQDKFRTGFAENVVLKEASFPTTVQEVKVALKEMLIPLKNCKINADLTVDVNVGLHLDNTKLKQLLVKFREVKGDFICRTSNLSSLEGSPKIVNGDFMCVGTQIKSLKGGPEVVNGDVEISDNTKLTSLEGCPKKVSGRYNVSGNSLTSLKGAPSSCNTFMCNYNNLVSLEGSPNTVNGVFDCSFNNLTSFKGGPKIVKETFMASNNNKIGRSEIEWVLKNIQADNFNFGPKYEKYNG
jgi:hypothetical protein